MAGSSRKNEGNRTAPIIIQRGIRQDEPGVGDTAVWGGITGTLSSQTDLQDELDDKAGRALAYFLAG